MAETQPAARRGISKPAVLLAIVGLGVVVTLLATHDLSRILAALRVAGWGILLVVALHLPQAILSGLGFGALIDRQRQVGQMWLMRWLRESVNTLLPVAQVGGDVVRVRLLVRGGMELKPLVAASLVDVTAEMGAQLAFTLLGVAVLLAGAHASGALPVAATAVAATAGIALIFVVAQRFGLVKLVQRGVERLTRGGAWAELGDMAGLEEAVLALYRDPRKVALTGIWHLASWAAGIAETLAALHVLGLPANLRDATVIESLGQAIRAFGFLIPGALGVQEGGYLFICAMFGIAGPQALALSLLRRIRELALGLPGLAAWQWLEWQGRQARG
ncbi:lysylphosphatidylglycerol synthase domain-containing protein [Sphingomonas bacterium]|uniref:lysylphosphatidylglycerol synthase domain-containing protein n=1 Tax=Sphingomonas bacterium TaxID=1895847 RepID=UPI0015750737|nr:lysylphosphatidylglycerol synthase domain-containing protein [Sphingomonas bacterium]